MTSFKIIEKANSDFNKLASHPLQSPAWGDFRSEWGNIPVTIGEYENDKLVNSIQIIFSKIPKTKFTIGTVFKGSKPTREMIKYLKNVGQAYKAIFIKLEPNIEKDEKTLNLLKELTFPGKRFFTPTTFIIDLTKSEEDLLKSFTSKTRYNIKLAIKHGVKVQIDNSDKAFERYLELTKETTQRQNFFAHSRTYHKLMWKHLNTNMKKANEFPIAHLLTATYNKEIISTWILFIWGGKIYYPYGASTQLHKNVMANNLMMWEAIKLGKKYKCTTFDLWGRETGKGFTKFKEGYNPKVIEFIGSWDIVVSFLYYPYRIVENLRWFILKTISKINIKKPSF